MTPAVLQLVSRWVERPREFAAGWIEGHNRFQRMTGDTIPASWFDRRTVGRAASQAAVAYHLALIE